MARLCAGFFRQLERPNMNLEALPQAEKDKANHHIYGEIAAVLGALNAQRFGIDRRLGAAAGSIAAGVLKEIWDKVTGRGDPSPADAFATATGALPVILGLSIAE
jgi:hypothetical protein